MAQCSATPPPPVALNGSPALTCFRKWRKFACCTTWELRQPGGGGGHTATQLAKAANTPIFGAGKTDKNRYAKKKKGGSRPQTEEFEDDIDGLQQAHEKKAKITKVPAADKFLIGTILTYVDHETVYLAETMRAVVGHLTFEVRNLRPRLGAFQTIPSSVICEWDGGNKTIPFANVVHDDMPVSHDKFQLLCSNPKGVWLCVGLHVEE